jgi:hypothetical protein
VGLFYCWYGRWCFCCPDGFEEGLTLKSKLQAVFIDLLIVFASASLGIAAAAGANFFNVHSGVWKTAVVAGLVAVVNFALQYINNLNTNYGIGNKNTGGEA